MDSIGRISIRISFEQMEFEENESYCIYLNIIFI